MMFEKASRIGLRFETTKGLLSTEDLWRIPISSKDTKAVTLQTLAKEAYAQLKNEDNVNFFIKSTDKKDEIAKLRFDIIKYIGEIRLKEQEDSEIKESNKRKGQKLLEIAEEKELESLKALTAEEIRNMAKSLIQ